MKKKYDGSIPLAVGLVLLVSFAGAVFFNCLAARNSLQPENMLAIVEDGNIKEKLIERFDIAYPQREDLRERMLELTESDEFDTLVSDYATYISEYIIDKNDEHEITEEQLVAFADPFVRQWYADEDLSDAELRELVQKFVDDTQLESLFTQADNYVSGDVIGDIQSLLSSGVRNTSLIIMIILALVMLLAAMPKRYPAFLGASMILTGGITIGAGKIAGSLFGAMSSNRLLQYLLDDYTAKAASTGKWLLIIGVVLCVGGGILMFVLNRGTEKPAPDLEDFDF